MMKHLLTIAAAAILAQFTLLSAPAGQVSVKSPDGRIEAVIGTGSDLTYTLMVDGSIVAGPSGIAMTLTDGSIYGGSAKLRKTLRRSVDQTLVPEFYHRAEVRDHFNEMTLRFGSFDLVVRAYDDGAAYRFFSCSKEPFKVASEQADVALPHDCRMWVNYVRGAKDSFQKQYYTSQENLYDHISCAQWDPARLAISPLAIEADGGVMLTLGEADILDYPGMYYNIPDGSPLLQAHFPPVPDSCSLQGTGVTMNIIRRVETVRDYIAECKPYEIFPWRTITVDRSEAGMLDSDMVWRLSTPADKRDWSWVKPGKAAWDWWVASSLKGVDFKSGFNTATYKHFIDFAAESGLEYLVMDGGWAVRSAADLMQVVPDTDMAEVLRYASEKGVGIILWAGYWPFHRDMEKVCRHYSEMGVKGFKVDFHNRDDQEMTRYYRDAAEMAAKYHLMLDFHGCSKPTGLQRTWPNVLSFEGVFGLEMAKFEGAEKNDLLTNELVIPFLRMQAGPMDYTSGAMRNASRKNFRAVMSEPMSQGTRVRQLAHFVMFETPFQMLVDSPYAYRAEKECLDFIVGVPVIWDETVALDGRIGEYAAIARRHGSTWYVAAMGGWDPSDRTLDLSFLPKGNFKMEVMRDGANADNIATDYRHETLTVPQDRKLGIQLASGGGFVAKIVIE